MGSSLTRSPRVSLSSPVSASVELRVTPPSAQTSSTALPLHAWRSSLPCLWRPPPSCARISLESVNSPPPCLSINNKQGPPKKKKKKKKKSPPKKKKKKKKKK